MSGASEQSRARLKQVYTLALCIAAFSTIPGRVIADSCHHLTPDGKKNCIHPGTYYESKDLANYYHLPIENICDKSIAVTAVCENGRKFGLSLHRGHGEIVGAPCGGFSGWYETGCEGEQSRSNFPARRHIIAEAGNRRTKMDSSFCGLYVEDTMRDGCYNTCATHSAAECASFLDELHKLRQNGH